jgi:hypothetical protein
VSNDKTVRGTFPQVENNVIGYKCMPNIGQAPNIELRVIWAWCKEKEERRDGLRRWRVNYEQRRKEKNASFAE